MSNPFHPLEKSVNITLKKVDLLKYLEESIPFAEEIDRKNAERHKKEEELFAEFFRECALRASKWSYDEIKENGFGIARSIDAKTAHRRRKTNYKTTYVTGSGNVEIPTCDILITPQIKSMIKKVEVSSRVKYQVEATNHNEIWQLLSQVHEKFKPVTGPSTVCG
jgi:hypothetical protein